MAAAKKTFDRIDNSFLERASINATRWIGSPTSLLIHTAIFVTCFLLPFFGISFTTILLTLTTIVSLEAIYLSILIQMSVNRQHRQLKEVSEDVGEIQENVEEMQEDVEEIQKDVEEIQEDVDEIQEDVEEITEEEEETEFHTKDDMPNTEVLERVENALRELGKEISEMKRRGSNGKELLRE